MGLYGGDFQVELWELGFGWVAHTDVILSLDEQPGAKVD
jgi:hypothetical protein